MQADPSKISVAGRRVLVTGGTRGVGRGIATTLAAAGADVLVCHRQRSELADSLAAELKATGGNHHIITADVSDPDEVARLTGECRDRLGGLDVVVNNAGAISHVPFAELSLAEWRRVVDTDLTAAFLVTQRALPLLGPGASIVNIGSRVATVGLPLRAHYTAAKAGLIGLTRSLCKELGPQGIRVNLVSPGVIDTEVELPEAVRRRYDTMTALGRLGRPAEIGGVVLFLASDLSSYVSGEIIHVDGGI
ncbi:MAG TPA: SDR family NAD(P)-dependent oxidoreductase [Rugosimonospora sp.]|nr:SDR family NAD(P)-dependent oxidoreductase [Rugosimonospora sp.]